jgi:hypothetical protein
MPAEPSARDGAAGGLSRSLGKIGSAPLLAEGEARGAA